MKKNNFIWILAIVIIFFLIILNLVIYTKIFEHNKVLDDLEISSGINQSNITLSKGKTGTGNECPDATGGAENAFLQVKYFYSKFCPWCMKEELILRKLVKNYGNLIHIEWHNINECSELVEKYKVSGVPTFIFSSVNNRTEYSHYGFVPEKDLAKLICDVAGC